MCNATRMHRRVSAAVDLSILTACLTSMNCGNKFQSQKQSFVFSNAVSPDSVTDGQVQGGNVI